MAKNHKDILAMIVDYFSAGCKHEGNICYGLELEHFVVDRKSLKSVQYFGQNSIQSLLGELSPMFAQEHRESENLLGLVNDDVAISLEPGGQLELSIKHSRAISDIERCYTHYRDAIESILEKRGQTLITQGYLPASCVGEMKLLPKSRYRFMDEYFKGTGSMGINMMRATASCHVSVDYTSEADFVNKYQCAYMLSPLLALIASNSPTFEGKLNNNPLLRTLIWRNVDAARSGIPQITFDPDFSFAKYAEYALGQNAIFKAQNGIYVRSHRNVLDVLRSEGIGDDEYLLYLSLVFPDVRLRQYIEIRVADSMPPKKALAYVALIKGLFADITMAMELLGSVEWSRESIIAAQDAIMQDGMNANVYNEKARVLVKQLCRLALSSLSENESNMLQRGFSDEL